MRIYLLLISGCLAALPTLYGQGITPSLPKTIDPAQHYLFYLHGGIVQQQGPDAVSPYYGPYLYFDILDSLSGRGFHVISEVRPRDVDEISYAEMLEGQVDSLLARNVPPKNIILLGASLGAYVALEASLIIDDPDIKYILLGLCSDYAIDHFAERKKEFIGQFLSIYEASDEKGSCAGLFSAGDPSRRAPFDEIRLSMGNSHGFLYKPYPEWIDPAVAWAW